MNQLSFPVLSIVIFLPAAGALLLAVLPRSISTSFERLVKALALIVSLATFLVSLLLLAYFQRGSAAMQFGESATWVADLGIGYRLGVDGISLWLVLLTTFLTPLAVLASWTAIKDRLREYMVVMLLLETGMLGVFCATDLFLFYVFWEAMLIPMYFLIGVWGGPRRVYAAVKFVLFTMAGSVLMLVAILGVAYLHQQARGALTFDLARLMETPITPDMQWWLFAAFALAFAIKVPIFPLHTWLPDAHVEAPTAGSVLLAGVLLKMGVYGYLRFAIPLFPQAARDFAPLLAILGVIGIIYGALVAMMQPDIKKLVAYSSVSHLGFVVMGTFAFTAQGVSGGILQMVNHGLSTGALFLLVGMIYERTHTRLVDHFGGLARRLPVFAAFFLVVMLSSVGLPGLNGFVGEFVILLGVFRAHPWWAVFGATGVVLAAWYLLGMYQKMFQGEFKENEHTRHLSDIDGREIAILVPIVILMLVIGVYPKPFFDIMQPSVDALLAMVK